jgi:hypothetical protein
VALTLSRMLASSAAQGKTDALLTLSAVERSVLEDRSAKENAELRAQLEAMRAEMSALKAGCKP